MCVEYTVSLDKGDPTPQTATQCTAGTEGELWIGGVGVAFGYLNAPDLTRERFFSNPFGSGSGLVYRTGDVVRCREDGNYVFVRRLGNEPYLTLLTNLTN